MIPITQENFPHGVLCGCDCKCGTELNDGNVMGQDIQDIEEVPYYDRDEEEIPVNVLICINCYVGKHVQSV
jgi:hypothetical protein